MTCGLIQSRIQLDERCRVATAGPALCRALDHMEGWVRVPVPQEFTVPGGPVVSSPRQMPAPGPEGVAGVGEVDQPLLRREIPRGLCSSSFFLTAQYFREKRCKTRWPGQI